MAFDILKLVEKAAKEWIAMQIVPDDHAGVMKDKCITKRALKMLDIYIEHLWD